MANTAPPTDELHDLHELHTAQDAQADEDAFPVGALPPPMRDIVERLSFVRQMPPTLAACCSFGAVSAAIGKGLRVPSLTDKTAPANIYILLGAESGTGRVRSAVR